MNFNYITLATTKLFYVVPQNVISFIKIFNSPIPKIMIFYCYCIHYALNRNKLLVYNWYLSVLQLTEHSLFSPKMFGWVTSNGTLHEKIMFIIFASKQLLSRGEIIRGEGGRREGRRRVGGTVWFSSRTLKVVKEFILHSENGWTLD